MKISLTQYNTTATVEVQHDDLTLMDVVGLVRSLVLAAGYGPKSWETAIREIAQDYYEEEADDE